MAWASPSVLAREATRAYVQGWPAIDLGAVTVETGPESWAAFLEAAAVDQLAAALAELNNAAEGLP
jgi:hypothetical protein